MDEQEGLGLTDYIAILRRRRWYLIVPAVVIFAVAVAVAMLMPATYRSEATILIEQQQIPQDLVRSTVTSYADQRVQIISQRVMTTANLSNVIEKYDLYAAERKQEPMSVVVEQLRQNIGLKMVSADVVDPRSGSAKKATIAFTLSFDNGSPQTAQRVVNELVSLFLDENLRKRREAAKEASSFLAGEAERLATQIADLEAKVARFKEEHGENLPEMQQVNTQFLQRTESQLDKVVQDRRLLDERILLIESELARTTQYGLSEGDGNRRVLTPRERLMQLELQYLELSARVKENHPDRIYLEREIKALRRESGGMNVNELTQVLERARAALAERREKLPDTHPDVESAAQTVAALEDQLAEMRSRGDDATASQLPENPAYTTLSTQLKTLRAEQKFLDERKLALAAELQEYEARVKDAPKIEREYRTLTRDYDNAVAKYREIKAKEMEAQLGESLEEERKAERFVLIEPAQVPVKPIKPNRLAILFLGFVFSMGGGLGAMILKEGTGNALYSAKSVAMLTGAPPLAAIPYIETAEEEDDRRRKRIVAIAAAAAMLLLAIGAVHFLVKPLDLAAYKALQRAGLIESTPAKGGG